ncbi:MAG: hypothetical protein M3546_04010 [Actinomycetota bacterium]|nr:hypothetical protein [Actinomycetota bacterium]
MSVINRRNAVLGYATLKVLERRRKQKKRSASKVAVYLVLGLMSAGILAGLVALLVRRHRGEADEQVDAAVDEEPGVVDDEIAVSPEPLPAA